MVEINQEEFTRMQTQLISLRTENYELKDQSRRVRTDSDLSVERCNFLEKELEKCNKVILKSKKAKETLGLQEEIDRLTGLLKENDENISERNKTMMLELANSIEECENLKEIIRKKSDIQSDSKMLDLENELRDLKSENSALKSLLEQNETGNDTKISTDMDLKIATQDEKIKLLTNQLSESQNNSKNEISNLQNLYSQLETKTDKKQDLIRILQNEKDQIQIQSKAKLDEMSQNFENQLQNLTNKIEESEKNCQNWENTFNILKTDSDEKIKQQETQIENLKNKSFSLDENAFKEFQNMKSELISKKELNEQLQNDKNNLEEKINIEMDQIERLQSALNSRGTEFEKLELKLNSSNTKINELQTILDTTQLENEKIKLEYNNAKKSADSRKIMLDEQSIETQKRIEEANLKLKENEINHMNEMSVIKEQLDGAHLEVRRLHETLEDRANQEKQLKKSEALREQLQEDLMNVRNEFESVSQVYEDQMKIQNQKYEQEIETGKDKNEKLTNQLNEKMELIGQFETEKLELLTKFKIGEKKNIIMIKELKKLLQSEQKRANKFQEQLTELRTSLSSEGTPIGTGDASDNTDLSPLVTLKGSESHGSFKSSLASLNISLNDIPIQDEVKELLDRITTLQQNNWNLETRISHLEEANSALNDDLLNKSELIKYHIINSKADLEPKQTGYNKSKPKKLFGLKVGDGEDKDEAFRKVQRALEEEMVKNLHLKETINNLTK